MVESLPGEESKQEHFPLKGTSQRDFWPQVISSIEPMHIFDFVSTLTTRLQSVKQMAKKLFLTLKTFYNGPQRKRLCTV